MIEHVDIELLSTLLDLEHGSVDSDDVTNSVDDWEMFEGIRSEDDVSVLSLGVEGWVNNLKGADEHTVLNLVWE